MIENNNQTIKLNHDGDSVSTPDNAGKLRFRENKLTSQDYHQNELNESKKILNVSLGIIIASTCIIGVSIVVGIFQGFIASGITAAVGALNDWISSSLIKLILNKDKDRQNYFKSLTETEKRRDIMSLVKEIHDDDERNKLIEKIVDNYFVKSSDDE